MFLGSKGSFIALFVLLVNLGMLFCFSCSKKMAEIKKWEKLNFMIEKEIEQNNERFLVGDLG